MLRTPKTSCSPFVAVCLVTLLAACEAAPPAPPPETGAYSPARAAPAATAARLPTADETPVTSVTPGEEPGTTSIVLGQGDPKTDAATDSKTDATQPGASAAVTPPTSQGKGGATGFSETNFRAANGLSSSYKIDVPADASPTKAYGLHIHLHGDGGGGYTDFPNRKAANDLIGVTVKAPNRDLTWGREAGVEHGQFLQDLIQNELLKKFNVRLDRIYFSGVSGGSYFLAGSFLPTYGWHYKSGAFLMCGGEAPRVAFQKPEFLRSFKITWQETAGERDDIVPSVQASIAAYKKALGAVANGETKILAMETSQFEGPGGHCEFDGASYTTGIQYMMDKKFATVVAP